MFLKNFQSHKFQIGSLNGFLRYTYMTDAYERLDLIDEFFQWLLIIKVNVFIFGFLLKLLDKKNSRSMGRKSILSLLVQCDVVVVDVDKKQYNHDGRSTLLYVGFSFSWLPLELLILDFPKNHLQASNAKTDVSACHRVNFNISSFFIFHA